MNLDCLIKGVDVVSGQGTFSGDVAGIYYDSKLCKEDSMFVAVTGMKFDGHEFIPEAVSNGARVIVHEKDYIPPAGVSAIRVKDSRRALGALAKNFFHHPSSRLCLVGVTGTNGKTTITYLLESIFRAAGLSTGVLGTVNYRFNEKIRPAPNTTPESFDMQRILSEMADDGVTHVVTEVSSHSLDLKRVDDCDFDIGIFTNQTQDHLDYHKNMESYFQAKKRLFSEVIPAGSKKREYKAVVNADDEWGQRLIKETNLKTLSFGINNPSDVKAQAYNLTIGGIEARVDTLNGSLDIASPLIGGFNLSNILAAGAAAIALGIDGEAIKKGIALLKNVPGRLERVGGKYGEQIFIDYAHTDDALRRVLQNLAAFKKARLITVFGCGGDRDRGKRPLMGEAATGLSDLTIVTSDNPRTEDPLAIIAEIESGIHKQRISRIEPDDLHLSGERKAYTVIPDRKTAIEKAISVAERSDIVLIAGKGHEDYQIIGTKKIFFDDRVIAAEALKSLYGGGSGD